VIASSSRFGDKELIAYVVCTDQSSIDVVTLRNHVGRAVPDFMVPAAIVALDSLPLTPNWQNRPEGPACDGVGTENPPITTEKDLKKTLPEENL
jgi:hypothetical protein